MIDFPNAKINLGLRVLDKRADGYHNIATAFYPVKSLYDVLEIVESPVFRFECTGPYSTGLTDDNICVKAYNLLKDRFNLPPVHIFLYKNIPVGGGLGGGSSDAASLLINLNALFSLKLTNADLLTLAVQLGSDCPFFILNTPQYAKERGEVMENINVDLTGYKIEIIMPDTPVNTAWAYKQLAMERKPDKRIDDVLDAVKLPVANWKDRLCNDFEEVVFKHFPQIEQAKKRFYKQGAVYAAMSGSGAAVYGLFK